MLVLRNRNDYREHLERLLKMLQVQKKTIVSGEKDMIRHEGMEDGIKWAIEALSEWEKQEYESNKGT